jgi:hypothetical protein
MGLEDRDWFNAGRKTRLEQHVGRDCETAIHRPDDKKATMLSPHLMQKGCEG